VATTYKAPAGISWPPAAALAAWAMISASVEGAAAEVTMAMFSRDGSRRARGQGAEDRAWAHLQRAGLLLVARNYRVARGPHARGGEVDLICRERDGTLVFVEVRSRASASHGGAAASIGAAKRASLVLAAQHFIVALPAVPPCRFDVVAIDGDQLEWIKGAFDAS
jgi:putative endonuclease